MTILGIRGPGIASLFRRAFRQFLAHDMPTYAAAVTYHLLFSSLPFLIVFIALLGYLDLSSLFDWLRQRAEAFLLRDTIPQINRVLDQLQQRRLGMLSFGVAVSLWAASSAMRAMMNALNVVYGIKEERPAIKRYALSVLYTLILGLLMALVTTMSLVAPEAMQVLTQYIGMEPAFSVLWTWWLRWPAVVALLIVIVALLYDVAPDVEQRIRFVSPGAVFVVIAWIGASAAFNFYVQNISSLDALYGRVGTAIVVLLYVFLFSLILLFGAEINTVIENCSPAGKNAGEKRPGRQRMDNNH